MLRFRFSPSAWVIRSLLTSSTSHSHSCSEWNFSLRWNERILFVGHCSESIFRLERKLQQKLSLTYSFQVVTNNFPIHEKVTSFCFAWYSLGCWERARGRETEYHAFNLIIGFSRLVSFSFRSRQVDAFILIQCISTCLTLFAMQQCVKHFLRHLFDGFLSAIIMLFPFLSIFKLFETNILHLTARLHLICAPSPFPLLRY